VYCVQAIQSQAMPPNLNFTMPMKETGMKPETEFRSGNLEYVLSNSFGFGGNCTCLIFCKAS
jgi:3-oxoacyl-[acyl-carrier-protein] synthase II